MKQRETAKSRDARKISQGFVDLQTKTIPELEELIERQNKLLQNRTFLEKLPDKGKKILSFKTELEIKLGEKQECDETCKLLDKFTLNDKSAEDIEWNEGKWSSSHHQQQFDSDDEEDNEGAIDPLKLVATHSGTASGKITKVSPLENGVNGIKTSLYIDKVCEKFEKSTQIKERFKPNQLRNNDKSLFITSAQKVKERLGDKWEVTQATPPTPIYKDVVMISLNESLKLQKEQAERLREIEQKKAAERLLLSTSVKMGEKLPIHNITEYRSNKNAFDESVESSEENEENQDDSDSDNERVCHFLQNDEVENS